MQAPPDNGPDECESLLRRAIEMVKAPADRSQPIKGLTQDSPGAPTEPVSSVPVDPAPPSSVTARADSGLDEHEALLRRAIEALRGAAPQSQPDQDIAEQKPGSSVDVAGSVPVHFAPPTSVTAQTDGELDEIEVLLRRAKEMVRDPAPRSRPAIGLTDDDEPAMRRVVAIAHDPRESSFTATDTLSGVIVLRHQDSERLRAMCERIGWQVVDGTAAADAED